MERLTEYEIQLLREVSIFQVLGVKETGRRVDGSCPVCNNGQRTPCFSMYPDNSFHCYSCEAHGNNAIDLVAHMTGRTNKSQFLLNCADLFPYVNLPER